MPRASKGQAKEPKVVACYHCPYATKIKSNLKKHIVNVHVLQRGGLREKYFNCPMCQFTTTRTKMMNHYAYEHNVSISKSHHSFSTMDDFRTWKVQVEKDEAARYVVLKGVSRLKTCHVWYYRCHRDGFFNSKGTGKRNIKVKGTNKINGCCPSEMKVMEDKATGKVQVHFVKTHFGHSQDLNRLPLLKEDKDLIAEKLALKIPLNKVLDEIQNSKAGDQLERIHLVTRKDVLNIASSYKLKNECVRRGVEGVGPEMEDWVKEVKQETKVIRLFKNQGELCEEFPQLTTSDFMLIVFNDTQLEYLKLEGSAGICIDRTHQRSQHDFELTTILVTDSLRQGFPCAYMLSNRSDVETISIFVEVVADAVNCPLPCDTFMSDVASFYYDAWCKVLPVPACRLYSLWHVDRAWRKLLMKIKNPEKRAQAYKTIRSLALERDRASFEQQLRPSIQELKADSETSSFAETFDEQFGANWTCWALCLRSNGTFSNITNLEHMHKNVRNAFFQGKKAKRLDKSMIDVMKLIRDRIFDQSIVSFKGNLPECLAMIRERHESCMSSVGSDVVIEKLESGGCKVFCESRTYDIVANNLSCSCGLRCSACGICVHSYRCSCQVSILEWCICKHVHYLASVMSEEVTHIAVEVPEIRDTRVHPVQVQNIQVHHVPQVHPLPQQLPQVAQHQIHMQRLDQPHQQNRIDQQLQPRLEQHHQRVQPVHTHVPLQVQAVSQPVQHIHHVQQVERPLHQHIQPSAAPSSQHQPQLIQHNSQHVQHPPQIHHPPQSGQHVSSQTVSNSSDNDDDDRSMEVLHICESNVARELEDLIFKQFTKPKERDADLKQAKNDALKLVQDIFDAVETRAQLEIFTNAILPVLPTITAMKYSGCTYK